MSKWEDTAGLVRVDSLHKGDVFKCIDGRCWTYDHTTNGSCIYVRSWDEERKENCFAACALVVPIMRKNYVEVAE
jgi:hypothetical protein